MSTADKSLSGWAPAKVNLYLHVGPPKPNGRHDLESLVMFSGSGAADHLTAEPAEGLSLSVAGPFAAAAGAGDDNLVLQAARALQAASGTQQGARLSLKKWLPVAAGIGGGSSDAATALRLLTKLWALDPNHAIALAPGLGGDVPVALAGQPSLMRGEGERVTPLPALPPVYAVLVNPGVPCPTGPVFRDHDAAGGGAGFAEIDPPPEFSGPKAFAAWLGQQRNDLESPAIARVPEIGAVLEFLRAQPGVLLARMSGSGATCFALCEALAFAERATAVIAHDAHKAHWWTAASRLGAAP
ncbi:4-diphosphocytidyl-2C-methyl-D-erythritol kinase [Hyphomonas neptunium ATCC 15444]|uniref:4-diphosphocytidyl-2-C-methyl-D-erythritol kinase n=2 Tax=Hyphomonas TaxID=85 RepID=ISPE_HYPNA|nr:MULTISPECIES: 4-(cytidine 5'-diphospho)-2-C-methyl-D-erythritol kinase [Hyphomonas]Q0C4D8.1 RecName: Full=4-diphosphocytidyl-2-C-methyl-D-erythritol kinase; Short=CMK; AltName: Full=4-(cytidine-5'-diphospho)-2-C-methyl-D-erythritol kinase [Hyphomonas neptunium ATCC 15444]ABI76728.1 4-diphosphocytidyl-2C-methyl-D-erythritol kinase [Hyphomonas neptunium ATCC 15444]KCZ96382.1 4-diphosphocytidyl-2-C-methyl-D-erythritol kinase [Hyphomonas hirschiana VP5]